MVTKLNRKALIEQEEVGSPQCARKESGSLRSRSQCPSLCRMSTLLLGHMSNSDPDDSSTISPTNYLLTILQKVASGLPTQFPATPARFCHSRQNQLHRCEFRRVSFCCGCAQLAGSPSRSSNFSPHTRYFCSLQTLFHSDPYDSSNISATNFSPTVVRITCGAVTNSKRTTTHFILHVAETTLGFVQCNPSRSRCCPTNSKLVVS